MEAIKIELKERTELGTRKTRAARKEGLVPCVLYGKGIDTKSFFTSSRDAFVLHSKNYHVITVSHLSGQDKVLIKKIDLDHLGEKVLHIDFLKLAENQMIEVEVPIIFTGKPIGVTEEGGVFSDNLKSLKVSCSPDNIPEKIVVDVSQLKLGQKLKVKDLTIPASVKPLQGPEVSVAAVHAPKVIEEAPAEVAVVPSPTEPEVIKKERKEEVPAEGATPAKEAKEKEPKK